MFAGRKLVIATKHHKEKVIAPQLESALGVQCIVPQGLDTDLLGTFSGEIARQEDPLTTAREKCRMAMELTGCTLAVASEGSFGPHPHLYFVSANDEILLLTDSENHLEIKARTLSTSTNFGGTEIQSFKELESFAEKVQFPSHGLILRPAKENYSSLYKGITDWASLYAVFHSLQKEFGSVFAETDMRALYNPMRMDVIAQTTGKLISYAQSLCPVCGTPGFVVTNARSGLPCGLCGLPTQSTLYYDYACSRCGHEKAEKFPKGKTEEDPMYCDYCNP